MPYTLATLLSWTRLSEKEAANGEVTLHLMWKGGGGVSREHLEQTKIFHFDRYSFEKDIVGGRLKSHFHHPIQSRYECALVIGIVTKSFI
jgi:hypothetical protein